MMKEEFEKRAGLVVSSEEYELIEAAYMGMPESVDKDKFVKLWLKNGGIQDLFDKRALAFRSRGETIRNLNDEILHLHESKKLRDTRIAELEAQVKALEEKLAAINALVAA
jgi:hypothetical protein